MQTGDEKDLTGTPTEQLIKLVKTLQTELKEVKEKATQNQSMDAVSMAKMFATFQAEKSNIEKIDYEAGIRSEDIPVEDYDEKGVTFSAPFTGYCIVDDMRKGHRVVLPFGKKFIVFGHAGTNKQQQGKHTQLVSMCNYTSHSKKETQWLRDHTYYNAVFYETIKGAMSMDVMKAQRIARILTSLASFELDSIIRRCREYQLPITDNLATMRAALAMRMADVEANSEKVATETRLAEIEKEKALLLEK